MLRLRSTASRRLRQTVDRNCLLPLPVSSSHRFSEFRLAFSFSLVMFRDDKLCEHFNRRYPSRGIARVLYQLQLTVQCFGAVCSSDKKGIWPVKLWFTNPENALIAARRCAQVRYLLSAGVCPSVALLYCIQTAKDIVKLLYMPGRGFCIYTYTI